MVGPSSGEVEISSGIKPSGPPSVKVPGQGSTGTNAGGPPAGEARANTDDLLGGEVQGSSGAKMAELPAGDVKYSSGSPPVVVQFSGVAGSPPNRDQHPGPLPPAEVHKPG